VKIKLITLSGATQTINVRQIVEIDDVPFTGTPPSTLDLGQRMNILEEAVSGLSDTVAQIMGHLFPFPPEKQELTDERSGPGNHVVRD